MSVANDIAVPVGTGLGMSPARARLARHLAIFGMIVVLWEAASRLGLIDPLFLPAPSAIIAAFVSLYVTVGNAWYHLGITLVEVFAGFFAGSALGIGLAILVGLNATVRRFMKPYIIVLEATPRIAVGPIIIAALGFGWTSKIAIVMLVCFFAPFVNTLSGMLSVNEDAREMFRSLGASKWQVFRKLMLPDAMPMIMAGLRLAMASALSGALVAEFISANEGMGVLLKRYTSTLNMDATFACLFTLTALGFLIFRSMERLDERLVFWRSDARAVAVGKRRANAFRSAAIARGA